MKVGKQAYVIGVGPVVVVEFGKGPTARVRVWNTTKEKVVDKTKLLAKAPKTARSGAYAQTSPGREIATCVCPDEVEEEPIALNVAASLSESGLDFPEEFNPERTAEIEARVLLGTCTTEERAEYHDKNKAVLGWVKDHLKERR